MSSIRVINTVIDSVIVVKQSSSSIYVVDGEKWAPLPFTITFEGLHSNQVQWKLFVEIDGDLHALDESTYKCFEGINLCAVCVFD